MAFELFCTPQSRNKKKLPKIFGEAEKLQFTFSEIIIRGWRWNHPSQKKLLIIHGFESTVVNFDRYIKPFIKKGYEVLAFDAKVLKGQPAQGGEIVAEQGHAGHNQGQQQDQGGHPAGP